MVSQATYHSFYKEYFHQIDKYAKEVLDYIFDNDLLDSSYFLNDNINTFDTDSELRLTIMSSIAQDEIRKLSERVRFGYKRSI